MGWLNRDGDCDDVCGDSGHPKSPSPAATGYGRAGLTRDSGEPGPTNRATAMGDIPATRSSPRARRRFYGPEIRRVWPLPGPHRGASRGARPDRLLGGGETLQDGDFGGRERHRRRLIWIDSHLVGHPQEPPCDNGIQRDRPFQPLTSFSWKVFDMTPSGFPREMQAFNPPAIAIPGHDALGVCCRGHRQRGDE